MTTNPKFSLIWDRKGIVGAIIYGRFVPRDEFPSLPQDLRSAISAAMNDTQVVVPQ